MTRKERYNYILDYFRKNVGEVSTELMFGSAFQLLCATLLSAQCTDKRINAITPALFAKFPDAAKMKKQMAYANAKHIPFVVLAGDNEIEQGKVTLKNMNTGEQILVSPDDLIEKVTSSNP